MSVNRRMLIDGYNVIYASEELAAIKDDDWEAARERLIRLLIEYGVRHEYEIEVVFDAAKSPGPASSEKITDFLTVTYTAMGKTADSYIESIACAPSGRDTELGVVVTGDYQQQKVVGGAGYLLSLIHI